MPNAAYLTSLRLRKMTYAAICLAIAMVLPFVTGQIPEIGQMLCPMHIPALLCGFLCGWPWGLAVGFIAPLLRGAVFGMPPLFPTGVSMAFELAAYGAATGWLYRALPKKKWMHVAALVLAMIIGRVIWGIVQFVIAGISRDTFTIAVFFTRVVVDSIPGIILQLILIPILVETMERAGLVLDR